MWRGQSLHTCKTRIYETSTYWTWSRQLHVAAALPDGQNAAHRCAAVSFVGSWYNTGAATWRKIAAFDSDELRLDASSSAQKSASKLISCRLPESRPAMTPDF